MDNKPFSFEGFSSVNIKTGELTPVDKNGKPITETEKVQDEVQDGSK